MKSDNLLRACVMGWPVTHSLSPHLHGYWLKKYAIHGDYSAMAVTPDNLKDALTLLKDRRYRGCNLTMPLKELALDLMDDHDTSCLAAGAVNTVVIENGRLRGFNSDGFGFVESLTAQHSDWSGDRVVILGTGGAARGIVAALHARGAGHFIFINRTRGKAEKLADDFGLSADIIDWDHRAAALADATLLVNCTSLGMMGAAPLDLDLSALPVAAGVCDIVYRPLITPLLTAARARGNPVIEGLPMLLHQGRLGFKHWFGHDPDVTHELYRDIARAAA